MNRSRSVLALAGLALAIVPLGGSLAQNATMPADPAPTQALPYVAMAGSSDMYEIASSRLALQRSQRADVKALAQMLIEHHTMTTQQVTSAAAAAGLNPPPPSLLPPQQHMLDELGRANGSGFDSLYLRQQRMAHDMALALHRNYAARGDTPGLRQVATAAVPIIQQHIDRLKALR